MLLWRQAGYGWASKTWLPLAVSKITSAAGEPPMTSSKVQSSRLRDAASAMPFDSHVYPEGALLECTFVQSSLSAGSGRPTVKPRGGRHS